MLATQSDRSELSRLVWLIPFDSGHSRAYGLYRGPIPLYRAVWITFRAFAAEDLAFRGFMARRIVNADIESVPYAKLTIPALLVSAVCFGLVHGNMCGPEIGAGLAFGLVAKSENRPGDAVAAHAIANFGIAA